MSIIMRAKRFLFSVLIVSIIASFTVAGHSNAHRISNKIAIDELDQSEIDDLLANLHKEALAGNAVGANPEKWIYLGTDKYRNVHYWDSASALHSGRSGLIWERIFVNSEIYTEIRIERIAYCSAGTLVITEIDEFNHPDRRTPISSPAISSNAPTVQGRFRESRHYRVPLMSGPPAKPFVRGKFSDKLFHNVCSNR